MKYSIFLLLICTSHLYAQSNICESKIDTLTKIRVYYAEKPASPEGGMQALYKLIGNKLSVGHISQFRADDCSKIRFVFIVNESGKAIGLRLLTKKYDTLESQFDKYP